VPHFHPATFGTGCFLPKLLKKPFEIESVLKTPQRW